MNKLISFIKNPIADGGRGPTDMRGSCEYTPLNGWQENPVG